MLGSAYRRSSRRIPDRRLFSGSVFISVAQLSIDIAAASPDCESVGHEESVVVSATH